MTLPPLHHQRAACTLFTASEHLNCLMLFECMHGSTRRLNRALLLTSNQMGIVIQIAEPPRMHDKKSTWKSSVPLLSRFKLLVSASAECACATNQSSSRMATPSSYQIVPMCAVVWWQGHTSIAPPHPPGCARMQSFRLSL